MTDTSGDQIGAAGAFPSGSWRLSAAAFAVLSEATGGDPTAGRAVQGPRRDEAWAELVRAGLATAPGQVVTAWRDLLGEAAKGEIVFEVVSRMGQAGMSSRFSLLGEGGLSVTEKRRLTVTDSEVVVDAVEDAIEVTIFPPTMLWPAVRRVLPPDELVRAEPGPDNPLHDEVRAVVTDVPERSSLPQEVLDQLAAADVEVSLAMQVLIGPDPEQGATKTAEAQRHWARSGGDLLEVRIADQAVSVVAVEPGSVASELVWLAVGAMEMRAQSLTGAAR